MDVVERLTLEAAAAETLIAAEHRHRYELARELCSGLRVLDLCCGSGYGTEMLAGSAATVVGVDNDAAEVDRAQATVGRRAGVDFEVADAVGFVGLALTERFDAVVCFEGLEHLYDLEVTLTALRAHAQRGLKIVASVPNSKAFEEENPFHVTDFGYAEATTAFAGFPQVTLLPQFLAEGSLICPVEPAEGRELDCHLGGPGNQEVEYANHFIFCVNFDPETVNRYHRGRLQLHAAPLYNRYMRGLERANRDLRRANARLARRRLGRSGSAGASHLVKLEARAAALEAELAGWRERALTAEEQRLSLARSAEERILGAERRGRELAHLQPPARGSWLGDAARALRRRMPGA